MRASALAWVERVSLGGTLTITRAELANDFIFDGRRFPLVDRGRGIRKPVGWTSALSIMTSHSRPYDDEEGIDGLHRYKLRRDRRGTSENDALREAMRDQSPLIWLYAIRPGIFNAISPVFLIAEEPDKDQFGTYYSRRRPARAPRCPERDGDVQDSPRRVRPEHSRDPSRPRRGNTSSVAQRDRRTDAQTWSSRPSRGITSSAPPRPSRPAEPRSARAALRRVPGRVTCVVRLGKRGYVLRANGCNSR
jgi:hypothetical protein